MEKMYKVYKVDLSFEPSLIHRITVGAIDKKDLRKHIENIILTNNLPIDDDDIGLLKYENWDFRINEIPNCYTDKPYSILDGVFHYV